MYNAPRASVLWFLPVLMLSVYTWGYFWPAYIRHSNVSVPAGSGRYSSDTSLRRFQSINTISLPSCLCCRLHSGQTILPRCQRAYWGSIPSFLKNARRMVTSVWLPWSRVSWSSFHRCWNLWMGHGWRGMTSSDRCASEFRGEAGPTDVEGSRIWIWIFYISFSKM